MKAKADNSTLTNAEDLEDPILPLYREWVAARIEWHRCARLPGNGNVDFPESKAATAREEAVLVAMTDLTPTSLAGIAALAHLLWDYAGPCFVPESEEFSAECEERDNKLIRAVWRAASGKGGLPPSMRDVARDDLTALAGGLA